MSAAAAPAESLDRDAFRREFVDFAIRAGQLDFQIFSNVHRADFSITHVGKRPLHSFALGIQNSFLWSNNYLRFHRLRNVEAAPVLNPDISQPRRKSVLGKRLCFCYGVMLI